MPKPTAKPRRNLIEVSTGAPVRGTLGLDEQPGVSVCRRSGNRCPDWGQTFYQRSNTTPTTTSPLAAQRRQRTSSFKMYFAKTFLAGSCWRSRGWQSSPLQSTTKT